MLSTINYESPDTIHSETALPTTLTNSEVELFKCTDQKWLHKSQLSVFVSVVNAGLTTATYQAYFSPISSTPVWYPYSLYNAATGVLTQEPALLNSTSFSDGTSWYGVWNIPMPACYGIRITGKVNTGTPTHTLAVLGRDN